MSTMPCFALGQNAYSLSPPIFSSLHGIVTTLYPIPDLHFEFLSFTQHYILWQLSISATLFCYNFTTQPDLSYQRNHFNRSNFDFGKCLHHNCMVPTE